MALAFTELMFMQDEAQLYVVTAYGANGDLAQYMANAGRTLTAPQAARYVIRPLLSTLAAMHAQQLIHRDIKPENCLMAADNTILLADFDLAIDAKVDTPCHQVCSCIRVCKCLQPCVVQVHMPRWACLAEVFQQRRNLRRCATHHGVLSSGCTKACA